MKAHHLILPFLLLTLPTHLPAQSWTLSLQSAPSLTHSSYKLRNLPENMRQIYKDTHYDPGFGFQSGLLLGGMFYDRLGLEMGVVFSRFSGYRNKGDALRSYTFISMPLYAKYYFRLAGFQPYLLGGAAIDFRHKVSHTNITGGTDRFSLDRSNLYASIVYAAVMGAGGRYTVNESIQAFAQLEGKVNLSRYQEYAPIERLVVISLNMGISVGLETFWER